MVLNKYTMLAKEGKVVWLPSIGLVTFKLFCGADLLESFAVLDLWNKDNLTTIVRNYEILIISR